GLLNVVQNLILHTPADMIINVPSVFEDPELIKAWLHRVQETIQRYDILEKDIYNMDETGFQMGVASTAKVICGSETRDSHAKSIQPGNHEWIIIITAVHAAGSVLPPQVIFAGKKHQSQWFTVI